MKRKKDMFSPYVTYTTNQPDEFTWVVSETVSGKVVGTYRDADTADKVRKAKETDSRDEYMRGWGGARPVAQK